MLTGPALLGLILKCPLGLHEHPAGPGLEVRVAGILAELGEHLGQRYLAVDPALPEQSVLGPFEILLAPHTLPGDSLRLGPCHGPDPGLVAPIGQDQCHDGRRGQTDQRGVRWVPPDPLRAPLPERRAAGMDRVVVPESAEVFGQLQGGAVTHGRLFVKAFPADGFQVAWDPQARLPGRRTAGKHLVENGAQRVDVGGRADFPDVFPGVLVNVELFGEIEVGELGNTVAVEQDVGRLELAMDDAGLMRCVQGVGERLHQLGCRALRLDRPIEAVGEAPAIEQLERDEEAAVGLAAVVDLDDIGVAEPGDRLGLHQEPLANLGVVVLARADHLQGDDPIQRAVPGLVDHPHPAAAQFGE